MKLSKKNFTGCNRGEIPNGFRLKSRGQSLCRKVRGPGCSENPPFLEFYHCWDITLNCVICSKDIACLSSTTCVCASCFIFHLQVLPAATCLYLRYSVLYTENGLWQVITFKEDFLNVEIIIASNYEMRINTEFKKL